MSKGKRRVYSRELKLSAVKRALRRLQDSAARVEVADIESHPAH